MKKILSNIISSVTHEKFKYSAILFISGIIFLILAIKTEYGSTILTINLFRSMGFKDLEWFGIANDFVKCVGFTFSLLAIKQKEKGKAFIFISVTIACLLVSFLASQAMDLNITEEQKINAYMNTDEYKLYLNEFNKADESLTLKQQELKKLQDGEEVQIKNAVAGLVESKNSYDPNKYKTKRYNIQKEIDSKKLNEKEKISLEKENINKDINKYENEKNKWVKEINKLKETSNFTTEGIVNLSKWMGIDIGKLGIGKNAHLEILGIVLVILMIFSFRQSIRIYREINSIEDKAMNNAKTIVEKVEKFVKPNLEKNSMPVTMLKKEKKYNGTEFINKVYQEVKKSKYKNSNQVSGIRTIASRMNLKISDIQGAWGVLKNDGKIITKNKKTYLKE